MPFNKSTIYTISHLMSFLILLSRFVLLFFSFFHIPLFFLFFSNYFDKGLTAETAVYSFYHFIQCTTITITFYCNFFNYVWLHCFVHIFSCINIQLYSLTGYYPPSENTEYTEDHPTSDHDFLTQLCRDWEASAQLPSDCTTRQVTVRIGVVLGKEGGILQQTLWPFWFGVGGWYHYEK